MPRRYDDEPDDLDDDPEFDLPEGVYHDPDDGAHVKCPHCGHDVPDDAVYCGRCENYLSKEDGPSADGKPLWVWVCLILALLATIWTAV